jgi:hypothetical protein
MTDVVGPFEIFYASPVQHPVLLWAAAIAGLVAATSRELQPGTRRYCIALCLLSVCDAWLTSGSVFGIGALSGVAASIVPLFFVLAGDLRYLLLVTCGQPDGEIRFQRRGVAAALGLVVSVPIGSQLGLQMLPDEAQSPRAMFLIYEVMFALVTLGLMRWRVRGNVWIRNTSRFVLLYYALWASADAIILATGSDLGYLLRVVPNLLYYGGLIGLIGWLAPERSR